MVVDGGGYWLTRFLFQRELALLYLLAFLAAARQFRPLAGQDGLLPLDRYVEAVSFRERPRLFHVVPSDRAVGVAAWTGVALASVALLEHDDATRALFQSTPFPDEPPARVRVLRYRYRFTTRAERAETGNWWTRERVGTYVPSVSRGELEGRLR